MVGLILTVTLGLTLSSSLPSIDCQQGDYMKILMSFSTRQRTCLKINVWTNKTLYTSCHTTKLGDLHCRSNSCIILKTQNSRNVEISLSLGIFAKQGTMKISRKTVVILIQASLHYLEDQLKLPFEVRVCIHFSFISSVYDFSTSPV